MARVVQTELKYNCKIDVKTHSDLEIRTRGASRGYFYSVQVLSTGKIFESNYFNSQSECLAAGLNKSRRIEVQ